MKKALIWCGAVVFVVGIAFTIFYNTPDRRAKRQAQQIMKVAEYLAEETNKYLEEGLDNVDEAKTTTTRVQIQNLETALRLFYLDNGFNPSTEQGLKMLVIRPANAKTWREGGYLEKGVIPKDPWGNDYIYRAPGDAGREYEILSLGRDGKEGGSGIDADISCFMLWPKNGN